MNSQRTTIAHRTAAVLATLTMLAVAGCGTGTNSSPAEVASPIVDASGATALSTIPDGALPPVPGDTAPGDTAPGGTVPEATTPPPPAPTIPPPPPPTTTTTTPEPVEPITIDLMQYGSWTFNTDAPDGAGASGEHRQTSPTSAGIRSYAWHGYNGWNATNARFAARYNATQELFDLGTEEALVSVNFRVVGSGALKAPWDRGARFNAYVATGVHLADPVTRELTQVVSGLEDEQDTPRGFSFDQSATLSFYVTRDDPEFYFHLNAQCSSWSGGKAFALLNEGYCDMYEAGELSVLLVQSTFSPVE